MDEIQKRQLEILNDTIAHYNSTNRSVTPTKDTDVAKRCLYFHPEYDGCAVGRLIKDKELCKKLDDEGFTGVNDAKVFIRLPEDLKELGQDFLYNLQHLHDHAKHWNEKGLSEEGLLKVETIKRKFKLT